MDVKEQPDCTEAADPATGLAQMLEGLTQFPPWPSALGRILTEFDRDDLDVSCLAEMISREVAILSKLLRVANSPFYGVSGNIANAQQAINTIGLSNTRSIVLTAAVMSAIPQNLPKTFDQHAFWQEAIVVAVAAEWLGKWLSLKDCDAFTAGMLHNIGKLLIAIRFPYQYEQMRLAALDPQVNEIELEKKTLGFTHAEAGAAIAEQWNFPAALIQGIRWHHAPEHSQHPLASVLAVSDKIASLTHLTTLNSEQIRTAVGEKSGTITLKDQQWVALLDHTRAQSNTLGAML
ncbi:MAG: HDOD domain-containing protein [Burkholderiaceae bacterium]|nr:MAG: HDOD domain-containing protein [Burkholderiaceae bacterium]